MWTDTWPFDLHHLLISTSRSFWEFLSIREEFRILARNFQYWWEAERGDSNISNNVIYGRPLQKVHQLSNFQLSRYWFPIKQQSALSQPKSSGNILTIFPGWKTKINKKSIQLIPWYSIHFDWSIFRLFNFRLNTNSSFFHLSFLVGFY